MPVAHHDVFHKHLAIEFPAYGHALWNPSKLQGAFMMRCRLTTPISPGKADSNVSSNFFLPANDRSHQDYGVSECHEPFQPNVPNHIDFVPLTFFQQESLWSPAMDQRYLPLGSLVAQSNCGLTYIFLDQTRSCKRKPGAVLSFLVSVTHKDTVLVNMLDYPLEVNN